jgi:hypothetical protein
MVNSVDAAPIHFRFDAEIVNVSLGDPFELPFEFNVGDTLRGTFAFEPGPGIPINDIAVRAHQPFPAEFNFNGVNLATSGYDIVASNDAIDYDSERDPYDGLVLGCRQASCVPDLVTLPNSVAFRVSWEMRITGNSSIWSTPAVVSDPAVWNLFTEERRIHVGFDNIGPGSVGFDAAVRLMVNVPEPMSVVHLFLSVICALYCYSSRNLRSYVGRKNVHGSRNIEAGPNSL